MASNTSPGQPDVILEVEGVRFPCNKSVLSSHSQYFQAMFSNHFVEKNMDVIPIQIVDASAMRVVLRWMEDATQLDHLNAEETLVVLQAAALLQLEELQRICEERLVQRWLVPSTCLVTAATADQLSLSKLYHKASSMALWRFSEVKQSEAFRDLSRDALMQYISQDSLAVAEEFEVFEAVCSWIEHKMLERCGDTINVVSCVRMNSISLSDLRSMLFYSCVSNCQLTQQLIKCVLCIKEGHEPINEGKATTPCIQESTTSQSDNSRGCCDTLRKLAGQVKSRTISSESSDVSLSASGEAETAISAEAVLTQGLEFTLDTIQLAQKILSTPERLLPTSACIVGHILRRGRHEKSETPSYTAAKKTKNERSKSGTPHVFFWDAKKSLKPVPLLHLSKIDQGPVEAVGYNVIGKGEHIIVVGGEYLLGYGDWNKSVWKYNVWTETWTYETSLSVPRRHHSLACLGEDMYVIGGCGRFRVIVDSVDRYNFIDKTWHKCAPLPCTMYSAAACVHKGIIYVITSQIFCYYPSTNVWAVLSDISIPPSASFSTAMSNGHYIYLTGLYSTALMRFNPDGEKAVISIGHFKNYAGNVCLVGNQIFCFAEDSDGPRVEAYNISNDRFEVLWEGHSSDCKISFKKLGGCFPFVLY